MNIVIVRTDRLGDILLTLPMASAIKKALPDARVTFLAREYTRTIIERCPDVDEVIVLPSFRLRDMIQAFRQSKADAAFFPSPRFPIVLAAWLARIPIRVGTGYRWYSFLFSTRVFEHRKTAEHHEAEYNLRMLSALSISADPGLLPNIVLRKEDIASANEWIEANILNDKFAVIHITSGGSTMQYPASKFVEMGRQILERYDMPIVLTGMESDRHLLEPAANSIGAGTRFFIGHPIAELAAILARASVVVSVGTGPGHLAATMSAPAIGLFPLPLALSKERWGYRGKRAINIAPAPIAACPNCKPCTCMERLTTGSVIQAINEIISS